MMGSPTNRDIVFQYAIRLCLTPYKWGGANPLQGVDCSQLVIELASVIGMPPPIDMTAQALHDYYINHGREAYADFGCIAFFGSDRLHITHTGFCLNRSLMIEAGGGNHSVLTAEEAALRGAFVRIRPIKKRSDFVCCVMPDWPEWDR